MIFGDEPASDECGFLYSVLNLPPSASDHEIRERYRSLSVIFHPDKQHDQTTKETASKRFLELQKAYEVLSDPFLRQVYDVLGEQGLKQQWPSELRSLPAHELHEKLVEVQGEIRRIKLQSRISPRGRLTYRVDARSLTTPRDAYASDSTWYERLSDRIWGVGMSGIALRHSVQHSVNEKTVVGLSARMSRGQSGGKVTSATGAILGTVRYQYSPRISLDGAFDFLQPHLLNIKGTYRDNDSTVAVQAHLAPFSALLLPPPLTFSLARKLYRKSLTQGILVCHTGPSPYLSLNIYAPTPFDLSARTYDPPVDEVESDESPGSLSGLRSGARFTTYGVKIAGLASALTAEWGVAFSELALQVKVGVEFGLAGLASSLSGAWSPSKTSEVVATVALNAAGIVLRFETFLLQQRLVVPIVLSQDFDVSLALCTTVLPSTAFVLGYHFYLKPRRRAERLAYFRAVRASLEEDKMNARRESEETAQLLKDLANKHTNAERNKDGLVILEASYVPEEADESAQALVLDVTIPLQALVHNSQLYIPGHQTKSGLQGFYDPAPGYVKLLRVRYLFLGREHYAEIPDYVPVVLPLEDHVVD